MFFSLILVSENVAQTHFGCRGGLNLSKYVGRDVYDAHFRPDFHAGIFLDYYLDANISLKVEAILSNRGSLKKPGNDTIDKISFYLRFIDFPILITQHVKRFEISAGLTPSFLLKAENRIGSDRNDLEMFYNPFAMALVIGGQYNLKNGLLVGARLEYGLLSLVDENIVGETNANMINLQFYLGYTFFKKE